MANSEIVQAVLSALEKRREVKPQGKGWRTHCPNPEHEDRRPSFFLYPGGGGRCFSQCNRYWPPYELAKVLGIELPHQNHGLTLPELAQAKGLPEDFLRSLGVADGFTGVGKNRRPCVDVPYADESGQVVAVRKRLSLEGHSRFVWRRGDHPTLYGLTYLKDIRKAGSVVLVEGETDSWTLWYDRIPALGVPGASTWRGQWASLLQGLVVYVWHEPDGGGDELVRAVAADLPDVRIIEAPPGAKDPSELYLQDPDGFKERFQALLRAARPASELRAEALSAEARESFERARPLLENPSLLSELEEAIRAPGYVGDPRPALMSYVAVTSRLLEEPLNLAYISQSATGKNAAIDTVLPFFPEDAYYLVRASSPRALVYNDEVFTHRTVVLTEADSLPEEGPAASAMRALMSDREMSYEVVEKGEDGSFHTRKIVKPGPTGLITTSIKPLGDQASTRVLTVSILDSAEQTRLVLHAQADKANQSTVAPDLSQWVALQKWLELAGERRVVIPFAHALADLVPATAVRMRRDFHQLLTVIQAVALLHQRQRERDSQGRIVASLDDYAQARWLLEEVFTTTVHEGLTPAVRETVEVVTRLSVDGSPVTEQELARELGLAKSTIHYRVQRALKGGWLVNQTAQKGAPAQLVVGAPLPDGCPLPKLEGLLVCVEDPQSDSNPRTPPPGAATGQIRTGGSNEGSNGPQSCADRRFERFESFPGGSAHTRPTSFVPTRDWQEVPDGAVLPPGLEIRMTLGGKNYARIPPIREDEGEV